jgi:DNA-directed RNA polymerase specialized sigma24 family protein
LCKHGEDHHNIKLGPGNRRVAVALRRFKHSYQSIADLFGVSERCIRKIVARESMP